MKLKEWSEKHPGIDIEDLDGFMRVFVFVADWDLSHLEDYIISAAVSGPSFILIPRTDANSPSQSNS